MSSTNQHIEGVVFDMDGVLCDSEQFICMAARRMFAETYNCSASPEDFLPFVGTGENRYLRGVAEKYGVQLDLTRDKASTYAIYLEIVRGQLKPLPGAHRSPRRALPCRRGRHQRRACSQGGRIWVPGADD